MKPTGEHLQLLLVSSTVQCLPRGQRCLVIRSGVFVPVATRRRRAEGLNRFVHMDHRQPLKWVTWIDQGPEILDALHETFKKREIAPLLTLCADDPVTGVEEQN